MPQDLTDEDRAAIKEAWRQEHTLQCDAAEYAYRAGLAAGRERAIEECAKVVDQWRRTESRDPCCDQAQHDALCDCAAAIRALLQLAPPPPAAE